MPELYAVLMPRLPEMSPVIITTIWMLSFLALSVLSSKHRGLILRTAVVFVLIKALVAWGSSVYAFVFLLFPANYWTCGWCWIW